MVSLSRAQLGGAVAAVGILFVLVWQLHWRRENYEVKPLVGQGICRHGACPHTRHRSAGRNCLNRARTKCCDANLKNCKSITWGDRFPQKTTWGQLFGLGRITDADL